jgi:anti-sigma factor RsiW
MTFDDNAVAQYFNGRLSHESMVVFEQKLMDDPSFEQRVMALDPARAPVATAFAHLTPPAFTLPQATSNSYWKPAAIGLAACLAIGAVGLSLLPGQVPDWHVQVAQYQALYTPQTIAMIENSPTAKVEQFDVLAQGLGVPFGADDLEGVEGLELLRGQLLGFEDQPLAQIVFASDSQKPIALCLMQTDAADNETLVTAMLSGIETVSWVKDGYAYILLGDTTSAELATWAGDIQQRI